MPSIFDLNSSDTEPDDPPPPAPPFCTVCRQEKPCPCDGYTTPPRPATPMHDEVDSMAARRSAREGFFAAPFPRFRMAACLMFFLTFLIRSVAPMPYDGGLPGRLDQSVIYSRTDLYRGLRSDHVARLDQLMDNRLSASSMRTVSRAVDIFRVVADRHGWGLVIATDEQHRGAMMVTFVLHLLDEYPELVWDSISSYCWGYRTYCKLNHQADPIQGVMGWYDFMKSIKVLSWVPHEPRRAIPLSLIREMLTKVDPDVFWHVRFALFMLVLLFMYSRTECPAPKHHTGPEAFDAKKHWQVRDLTIRIFEFGAALTVRFKAIKQDPRIERREASAPGNPLGEAGDAHDGGSDWAIVGDIPQSKFSVFKWFRHYLAFFPMGRDPKAPFFVAADSATEYASPHPNPHRAYTYTQASLDLQAFLTMVGCTTRFGLHGLRVEGYNLSKAAVGEELTVAHGGWRSTAHMRYSRFSLSAVANMAALMVDEKEVYSGRPEARTIVREELSRGAAAEASDPSVGVPAVRLQGAGTSANPHTLDSEEEGSPPRVVIAHRVPSTVSPAVTRSLARGRGRGGRGSGSGGAPSRGSTSSA